jgi:CRP/FNR family cyclic AMP-dependent transcriptional regulator
MELEMEKGKGKGGATVAKPPQSRLYKPEVALAFFKAAGKPEQFAAGKPIFVENEGKASIFSEGSRMYLLLDGEVELSVGKKPIGAVAQGEVFGEMASLTQLPRSATATAKTACTVISLNEKQFQEALGKSPEFAVMLMAIIIGRLRDTIAQVGGTLPGAGPANKATVFDKKLLADLQKEMEDKPPMAHHLNKVIMKEGDRGIFMYLVMEGIVAVTIQEKPVEKVGAGGVFGEMALVDQSARVATATAETDCTLLSINRNDFMELVKTKPAFALSLLKALSERLRFMTSKLTQ